MIEYHNLAGRVFQLNGKYPVYDDNDNVIGYTSGTDIGVVVFDGMQAAPREDYLEVSVATGEYAGYSGLALAMADIAQATYIGDKEEDCIYAHGVKLR